MKPKEQILADRVHEIFKDETYSTMLCVLLGIICRYTISKEIPLHCVESDLWMTYDLTCEKMGQKPNYDYIFK